MNKRWYVVRRLAWTAFATVAILTVTFGLLQATPNPQKAQFIQQQLQTGAAENYSQAERQWQNAKGSDRTVVDRYVNFMTGMVTLNWGWSDTRAQPVLATDWGAALSFGEFADALLQFPPDVLGAIGALLPKWYGAIPDAWPFSLMYGVPALVVSTVLGLAIGFYTAVNQNTKRDYVATAFAYFGLAIPDFWFGILLIVVFGLQLGWIPLQYQTGKGVFTLANAHQLVGPVTVLTLSGMAGEMRYSRAAALEQINETFVKTARAKGASGYRVVSRHIMRPALVPLATILVGDLLGVLLVASYLVEVVFGIPGLGQLSFKAITQSDTRLVLGTILVPTFIALIGNLLQDIAYTVLDPRIEIGEGGANE